ncbi:MAG TPA: RnfABCDGE type electron transport complex subunit D [Clostridia bacterium]|nr:RnfABCDGE type electron transport complex subunit D [Clostridia bacterium]
MNTYPLIRSRWSNEHLLTVLFLTVSLYQLPDFVGSTISIFQYMLIVVAALTLDATINYIRYKKPVCAVSSAVTAAVLYPVIKGLPGWAGLLGVAAALIIGKHIWGGTGKNIFNPAVMAMFLLSIIFPLELPLFNPASLLIPALVLSLPFIAVRLFPGLGFLAGMLAALYISDGLSFAGIVSYGAIYWSCIVITDPVTATDKPVSGLLTGFLAGFLPLLFSTSLFALSAALLLFNGISYILNRYSGRTKGIFLSGIKIEVPLEAGMADMEMIDMTEEKPCSECIQEGLEAEEIMKCIERNDVFGMGGAGFPTIRKIETVKRSGANEKYLIVNGMECDPGLIHDKWLMRNRQAGIAGGMEILGRIAGFRRTYYIAKEISGLHFPEYVEIHQLPDRYPYGAEKLFVEKLLGISIPADSHPAQYGVLVLNVQTVLAVYEAVYCNKKADTRFITVADLFADMRKVVKVKIGDHVSDIVEKTVGSKGITFVGGGIMQVRPAEDSEVIGKTTNFIAVGMLPRYKESLQCINCGLCRLCCPMGLNVKRIADLVDEGKLLEAQTYNTERCISCGSCSYVCPAGKNLSGRIAGKKQRIS